ncbi:Rrf2 family transcriptional regulator [Planctomycetota bacterium]|nr:Rrf2 family transcriptional regulator [Planctomycetota bacterium]
MFSQTSEHAIRAMIEIATRDEGAQVLSSELSEALGIPQHYLSKILQQLVRTKVLVSTRGRNGGFGLAKPASKIKLRQLVEPFDDLTKYDDCILGQVLCNDSTACPLHDFWAGARKTFLCELDTKTLKELGESQLDRLAKMTSSTKGKLGNLPGRTAFMAGNQKSKK